MLGISGGLRIDHIITLDGVARPREMGGNSIFAAVGARLWIDEVNIMSRAGENYPREWLAALAAGRLTRGGIRIIPGWHEQRTFYAYQDADTRDDTNPAAHYARIGQPMPAELEGYVHSNPSQADPEHADAMAVMPADLAGPLDAYHLAPMAIKSHLLLPAAARALGARVVSVDPGERYMVPRLAPWVDHILAGCDIFMPSALEVSHFFGDDTHEPHELVRRMRWFAARGPRIVVFKLGSRGSLVLLRDDQRVWHFPALTVRVIDVTGAGDAYCGGFVGHFRTTADPVEAAIAGTVSASFAIEDYGAMHVLNAARETRDQRAGWVRAHAARVL